MPLLSDVAGFNVTNQKCNNNNRINKSNMYKYSVKRLKKKGTGMFEKNGLNTEPEHAV